MPAYTHCFEAHYPKWSEDSLVATESSPEEAIRTAVDRYPSVIERELEVVEIIRLKLNGWDVKFSRNTKNDRS